MRIGIDARFVTQKPMRGIGSYSKNIINELFTFDKNNIYFLYTYHDDENSILPKGDNIFVKRLRMPFYPLWEQLGLPLAVVLDKVDILHCLGNTAPIFLSRKIKLIVTIHDVMYLHGYELVPRPTTAYQFLGRLYRRLIVPMVSCRAHAILTVSNYSKNDIVKTISNITPSKVFVTYQSCSPAFSDELIEKRERNFSIPSIPYIFALGADDPRKNTRRLVNAYIKLIRDDAFAPNLIICGSQNWKITGIYDLVVGAGAEKRILLLDYLTLSELIDLYKHAICFVYPSIYEGFGIPILEAFAAGCAVTASNSTSIPEVAGDAALFFDPLIEDSIAGSIKRLVQTPSLRQELCDKGKARAKFFLWSRTAEETVAIYEKVIRENH